MRCPDCNKFVSYGEPGTDNLEIEVVDGKVRLSGQLTLPCADCGTELAGAELEAEEDATGLFPAMEDLPEGHEVEFEVVDVQYGPTDRTETKDRHGKPIKNPRFMRHYYGVEATVTVRRTIRDEGGNEIGEPEDVDLSLSAEEQASAFESLV